jgi:hypothetical protein
MMGARSGGGAGAACVAAAVTRYPTLVRVQEGAVPVDLGCLTAVVPAYRFHLHPSSQTLSHVLWGACALPLPPPWVGSCEQSQGHTQSYPLRGTVLCCRHPPHCLLVIQVQVLHQQCRVAPTGMASIEVRCQ